MHIGLWMVKANWPNVGSCSAPVTRPSSATTVKATPSAVGMSPTSRVVVIVVLMGRMLPPGAPRSRMTLARLMSSGTR